MRIASFLLAALIFTGITAFKPSTEMKWYDWSEGYTLAKKNKKILLVDCYTDWCGWCKVMDRETYSKDDIQKKIYADFIPVKLNPEKNQTYIMDNKQYTGPELLAVLTNNQLSGYPTVLFIIPNGKTNTVEMSVGYSDATKFSKILDEMKAKKK